MHDLGLTDGKSEGKLVINLADLSLELAVLHGRGSTVWAFPRLGEGLP